MKPLCELMSLEFLPTVRALIARKLVQVYGLSQKQAAEKLGTTQPAISQYTRELRGYKTEIFTRDKNLLNLIDSISKRLASGELSTEESSLEFCRICRLLRSSGIACEIHRKAYPSLGTCSACDRM